MQIDKDSSAKQAFVRWMSGGKTKQEQQAIPSAPPIGNPDPRPDPNPQTEVVMEQRVKAVFKEWLDESMFF